MKHFQPTDLVISNCNPIGLLNGFCNQLNYIYTKVSAKTHPTLMRHWFHSGKAGVFKKPLWCSHFKCSSLKARPLELCQCVSVTAAATIKPRLCSSQKSKKQKPTSFYKKKYLKGLLYCFYPIWLTPRVFSLLWIWVEWLLANVSAVCIHRASYHFLPQGLAMQAVEQRGVSA